MIRFRIHGLPIAKARARTVRLPNGGMTTYTPATTRRWEDDVRLQALQHKPDQPLQGALVVTLVFALTRPKSAPKKRAWPEVKPDVDNLTKSVLDALRGIYYTDDAQIVRKQAVKCYDPTPGVVVFLRYASTGDLWLAQQLLDPIPFDDAQSWVP